MKIKFRYLCTLLSAAFLTLSMMSCEDMLDTDSNRLAFEKDNELKSPNDTIYSVMGILSQLQKIGDRYVILGELRGDLMTTSSDASISLKEINNFQITSENVYRTKYDYYSIINNCNYAISRMDTSFVSHNQKVMLPEFVAIKVIRAWTYMQMSHIFGTVQYYEKPILSLEEAEKDYPEIDMETLADMLIKDLLPYVDVRPLDYGEIDGQQSYQFFVPVRMILGDLYLFLNKYEQAATMYHGLIYERYYILPDLSNYWVSTAQESAYTTHLFSYRDEVITKIPFSSEIKDFHSNLVKMSYDNTPSLLPTQGFIDRMTLETHFHAKDRASLITAYFEGDLRGSIKGPKSRNEIGDAYNRSVNTQSGNKALITKYINATENKDYSLPSVSSSEFLLPLTAIPIYRNPQLYLRYAEAVNRIGKPTLAFSVLKYGLNNENMTNPEMVNPSEIEHMEPYIDFRLYEIMFNQSNIASASRGRGLGIGKDLSIYVIPDYTNISNPQAALQDSIDWVESQILNEMAAETAFEGSRFFDLLRISRRRENHPEFMAEKVSLKYDNPTTMKARLMDLNAWFVK